MGEILDKMLLIVFGLVILLSMAQILSPIIHTIQEDGQLSEKKYQEIQDDIEDFKSNIEKGTQNEVVLTYDFLFKGDISVVVYIKESSFTKFRFAFISNTTQTPIYEIVDIKTSLNISFESIFVKHYSIFMQNSSRFLIFY